MVGCERASLGMALALVPAIERERLQAMTGNCVEPTGFATGALHPVMPVLRAGLLAFVAVPDVRRRHDKAVLEAPIR